LVAVNPRRSVGIGAQSEAAAHAPAIDENNGGPNDSSTWGFGGIFDQRDAIFTSPLVSAIELSGGPHILNAAIQKLPTCALQH
jgi:hypothetical protein